MLTLWYLVLGWKEYNKPTQKTKPVDPTKKPDLIPQKKDVIPTQPKDIKKPEPPKSIPIDPKPPAPQPFFNNKAPETPKISDTKPTFPAPKTPETPKMPEPPKVIPKAPEIPKMPESPKVTPKTPETSKMPEPPKVTPRAPETPKTPEPPKVTPRAPETPKTPEPPKVPPRTPETPKMPEFRLAPEPPKKPETPKTPDVPKFDSPQVPPNVMPSRRPESTMPDFASSGKNPAYVPPGTQTEFPLPPYLPGAPQGKPLSKDDEVFAAGNSFKNPNPNSPIGNLRDLSYAKGEFPVEDFPARVQEKMNRISRYLEEPVLSNPDSLESDEEDEDF